MSISLENLEQELLRIDSVSDTTSPEPYATLLKGLDNDDPSLLRFMHLTKSPFTKIHIAKDDRFELNLIGISPGCETPVHHHNDMILRLEMVIQGRGLSRGYQEIESKENDTLLKLDHSTELTPGSVMILDGRTIHQISNPHPEELWVITLYLPHDTVSTHYELSEAPRFNTTLAARKVEVQRD